MNDYPWTNATVQQLQAEKESLQKQFAKNYARTALVVASIRESPNAEFTEEEMAEISEMEKWLNDPANKKNFLLIISNL